MQQISDMVSGYPASFLNKYSFNRNHYKVWKKRTQTGISSEVLEKFRSNTFPNLESLCLELLHTFRINNYPYNAMQFMEVLNSFHLNTRELIQILNHPEKKHVLLKNDLIKVIIINWDTNDSTQIHGHPEGGCAIKIMHGNLVENRYSSDSLTLLDRCNYQAGDIAYIDDNIALHSVENPFNSNAISLHVYTPGV